MSYFVPLFLMLIAVVLLLGWYNSRRRNGDVIGSEIITSLDSDRHGAGR
jgi:hypothetical protein